MLFLFNFQLNDLTTPPLQPGSPLPSPPVMDIGSPWEHGVMVPAAMVEGLQPDPLARARQPAGNEPVPASEPESNSLYFVNDILSDNAVCINMVNYVFTFVQYFKFLHLLSASKMFSHLKPDIAVSKTS